MKITQKQAHVLANLNRVAPCESKLRTLSSRPRFQLDGSDCTAQIRSLIVGCLIWPHVDGQFRRRDPSKSMARDQRIGERQPPSPNALAQIKAFLSSPVGD